MRKFMFHETESQAGFVEVEKAYPVAVVDSRVAEAFGMEGLPNVIVKPDPKDEDGDTWFTANKFKAVKKLKTITSYAGLARFLELCEAAGEIAKPDTIRTPYAYSQTINTYTWSGKRIIVPEVRHRRYEVWRVDKNPLIKGETMTLQCPQCKDVVELTQKEFESSVVDAGAPMCPDCEEVLEVIS